MTAFGWPLLVGGSLKATYDLILLNVHDVAPDMGADWQQTQPRSQYDLDVGLC